jgi:hypothetical protein
MTYFGNAPPTAEQKQKSTIPNYKIDNLDSFNGATSDPHQVAGLYFFYTLDCLIDLAYKVSRDFYDKPELFTDLGSDKYTDLGDAQGVKLTTILARLHARYGTDEKFLNKKQRHAIYCALFGNSASMESSTDEEGDFPNLRDELIEACALFVETKFGDEASLRENVRQKHILFKEYLNGLKGASVEWSREGALSDLTERVSYRILRNDKVSAVYGIIRKEAREQWPYDFDAKADILVEKISEWPMRPEKSEEMDADGKHERYKHISREQIANLQRAAIEGARAIATVIDVEGKSIDADVDQLITRCYTWGTALKYLSPQKAVEPRRLRAGATSSEARLGTYGRS